MYVISVWWPGDDVFYALSFLKQILSMHSVSYFLSFIFCIFPAQIRQEKGNDLNVIYTEIRGPSSSFYEGGFFVIRFEFTNDYPVSSPSVAFQTKIWHPNVDHS